MNKSMVLKVIEELRKKNPQGEFSFYRWQFGYDFVGNIPADSLILPEGFSFCKDSCYIRNLHYGTFGYRYKEESKK